MWNNKHFNFMSFDSLAGLFSQHIKMLTITTETTQLHKISFKLKLRITRRQKNGFHSQMRDYRTTLWGLPQCHFILYSILCCLCISFFVAMGFVTVKTRHVCVSLQFLYFSLFSVYYLVFISAFYFTMNYLLIGSDIFLSLGGSGFK